MTVPLCTEHMTDQQRYELLEYLLDRENWSRNCLPMDWLRTTDFFSAPASTRYHGTYAGGLFDHCMNVTLELIELTTREVAEPWQRLASPIIIGILHDVTKLFTYKLGEDGKYHHDREYGEDYIHGLDSLNRVREHMDLTDEEAACIRYHMGAYETKDWNEYSEAMRKFPNVLWTHTADMVASQILEAYYGKME